MNFLSRLLLTPLLSSVVFLGSGLWTLHKWFNDGFANSWYWCVVTLLVGVAAFYIINKQYYSWLAGAVMLMACLPLACYTYEYKQSYQLNELLDSQGNLMSIDGAITHVYSINESSNFKRYQVSLAQLIPQYNRNDKSLSYSHLKQTVDTDILLSLPVEAKALMVGDNIQCLASVREIQPPASPFDFNFQRYAYSQGIRHQAQVLSPVVIHTASEYTLLKIKQQLYDYRSWVKQRLSLGIDDRVPAYQLMLPLVLGIKNAQTHEALQSFKSLGLLHLFAISGLHLGLMLYLINRMALMAKLPYYARHVMIFAVLLYYTVITGWAPSIMRTSIFLLIWGISQVGRLPFRPFNALCVTFIISLVINPYQLFQIGFQLSFSIVLTLLIINSLWQKYAKDLAKPDAYIPVKFWFWHQRIVFICGQKIGQSFYISLFAFIASSGFMIYYFGVAYGWSILLTPFFIPLISAEICITCIMLAILPLQHDNLQIKANKFHLWYLQYLYQAAQKLHTWLPHASIEISSYKKPQLWLVNTGRYDHLICIEGERLHLFPQSSASLNSMQQLYSKLMAELPLAIFSKQPVIYLHKQQNPRQLSKMPGLINRSAKYLSNDNFSLIQSTLFHGLSAMEIRHTKQAQKILYLPKIKDSLESHQTYINEIKASVYQAIIIHPSWNRLYPDFVTQLQLIDSTLIIEQAIHGAIEITGNENNFNLRGFITKQTWVL